MSKRIIVVREVHRVDLCNEALREGWDLNAVIPDTQNRHGLGNGAKYILVKYEEVDRNDCKCDQPILAKTVIIDGHLMESPVASAAFPALCVGCGGRVQT